MKSSSAAISNSIPPSSLIVHIQTMRGHVMIAIQEATMFGTQSKDFSPCKLSIDNKPILLKPIAAKGW
jgi:hypothetical protein